MAMAVAMAPTDSAAVRRPRIGPTPIRQQRQDEQKARLAQVKKLYLERRFRACAALCETTLKDELLGIHPLHRSFLHFFAAVSYETLGLAAHSYSSNKLPYLNYARDAFAAASATRPQPYTVASPTTTGTRSPSPRSTSRCSSSASNMYSQETTRPSSIETVPNFDDYAPRQSLFLDSACETPKRKTVILEPRTAIKIACPDEELLPKPLTIKKRSTANSVPVTEAQRPLPPVPSGIAKHETAPFYSSAFPGGIELPLPPSPVIVQPPVRAHDTLQAYLSSHSQAQYNEQLSSFRFQLSSHISSVSEAIAHTTFLQREHRTKQTKRLASFWSFSPKKGSNDEEEKKTADKKARIEKLRQCGFRVTKERYGWKGQDHYDELRRRAEIELKI